jgi:hypothetical protein
MSAPDIPTDYTFTVSVAGAVDVGADDIRVKELPLVRLDTIRVEAAIKEIPKITIDSTVALGLDNIRIKELPKVELEFNLKPTRAHYPSHYKFCGSLFGLEIFSFSVCGESMAIVEPYLPHATEMCH